MIATQEAGPMAGWTPDEGHGKTANERYERV